MKGNDRSDSDGADQCTSNPDQSALNRGGQAGDHKEERVGRAIGSLVALLVFVWKLGKSVLRATSGEPLERPGRSAPSSSGREEIESVRSGDLDVESERKTIRRAEWGSVFVFCAFGAGIVAGVGFLLAYWWGGSNLLLGATLALFLAGFGSALVLSARWLMRQKEAVGPRENHSSSETERQATVKDFCAGVEDIRSRTLLKWMGAVGIGVFATMVVSLLKALGAPPGPSLFDTVWKRGQRLMMVDGKPVTADTLQPGDSITVFPEGSIGSEKAQTVLIRVKEDLLQLPTDRADWAPKGYVAYSRVCTHAGCPVGLFESKAHLLLCPCHQSTFDVLRAAQPTGGPAARALPQLPLYADAEGNLRAGSGFSEPPGPGFWGMP